MLWALTQNNSRNYVTNPRLLGRFFVRLVHNSRQIFLLCSQRGTARQPGVRGRGEGGGNWEKNAPKNAVNFLCVLSNKKELEVPAIGHRWRGAPLAPSLVNSEHQLS